MRNKVWCDNYTHRLADYDLLIPPESW